MKTSLEERVWAYLDGLLSSTEVDRFERDLLDPAVSQAFAEALMIRELLRDVGPSEAPDHLVLATEKAVLSDVRRAHPDARRFQRARAAFGALSWALRGPQMGLAGSMESTREALSEIGNARYSLGPLAGRRQTPDVEPPAAPRRSVLRRLFGRRK